MQNQRGLAAFSSPLVRPAADGFEPPEIHVIGGGGAPLRARLWLQYTRSARMLFPRRSVVALVFALAGCAAETDAEVASADESLLLSYRLSDAEARATKTRGDCHLAAGDLIFHRSTSEQAGAIAYLTESPLTHMGVVFQVQGTWNVYEAVGPVKITPLDAWIDRGVGKKFSTSRYARGLDAAATKALFEAGKPFYGKPYDLLFLEDDAKIYCSELALKMYERAHIDAALHGLWERVDTLEGWAGFKAELASPVDSAEEKLVKRIMAARGVDVHEFASQTLVAPVTLSDAAHSNGVFETQCSYTTH